MNWEYEFPIHPVHALHNCIYLYHILPEPPSFQTEESEPFIVSVSLWKNQYDGKEMKREILMSTEVDLSGGGGRSGKRVAQKRTMVH